MGSDDLWIHEEGSAKRYPEYIWLVILFEIWPLMFMKFLLARSKTLTKLALDWQDTLKRAALED